MSEEDVKRDVGVDEEAAKAAFFEELAETFKNAPTQADVANWKTSVGRVRVVAFAQEEVYFYRPIKSNEYKAIVNQVLNIKDPVQQNESMKEKIVAQAILWPKLDPTEMGAMYAGTKDSLHMMIMQASNFVTPEEAEVMVREL